jgi:hypothetical protein
MMTWSGQGLKRREPVVPDAILWRWAWRLILLAVLLGILLWASA